ncbi:MAG: SDR family NAD(P)-dependent oxidoreductase [Dolichospermum sp.]|jgi:NAD(P)-dependent dehydrogenase (short-subunit alcohol dehydrogenase family)|uniref:SDR family NAD(P)-dependent oxidoreductase n=1 Tax=unclassified Microcystis TaxID=2643300 RepID=UPI00258A415F|nr:MULTISPECIES: SDR family NAD(P)-dependent oxidoreductase [unclassified Microcystis]MCA2666600.1 SDR family NAD(P)-dependent oxidoreductase [Microcystis sp. M045S2]MCA2713172.1 SDR family NAD(P)-dependent oxidoreductase [Microcystis sp. M172S2]MCA2803736.1 SDR family NAD(P)-dependent oxidoreductase [Microcystis sp. M114S2]MCA2834803.1 SDR family NAD(P)-dependent oxidoreductase [Microcystis sp. M007S1]MCA2837014.1 SDR family NAD(P)-dependent oxidoreductase [Microcystis sp. M078S1]
MTNNLNDKVVLITGVSAGLGLALAKKLLTEGAYVAGTLRNREQIAQFEDLNPLKAFGVEMDITDHDAVESGVQKVLDRFGRIDVLANNAGSGMVGAVEETSEEEVKRIFDVNFFGGLRLIQAVLPTMRQQQSGHILQFSAVGGFIGYPGLGVYCAAKAATDILGEVLAQELEPFNIKTTVLTIGIFRTEFPAKASSTAKILPEYVGTPASKLRDLFGSLTGKQPNDPDKGADLIVQVLKSDHSPLHLPLGGDAIGVMRGKIAKLQEDIAAWENLAGKTAYE